MTEHHSPEQVTKLYELMQQEAVEGAFYQEAWDLRRLITFAWKRQYDSYKRGQTPRETYRHQSFIDVVFACVFFRTALLARLVPCSKDAGVRNLFALIQSIRHAQEHPEEQDEDWQEDEGEHNEEPVPDEAAPDDDEEAYDQWDEDEEDELPKETEEAEDCEEEEGEEEKAEDMPPPPAKKLKRSQSKARLRKGLSKESAEDPATPASKLPRASTDESYQEVPSASKEEELKMIMAKIQELQMLLNCML